MSCIPRESENSRILEIAYLAIRIDRTWECLRQPIQRDRLEDLVKRGRIVSPSQKLFPYPVILSISSLRSFDFTVTYHASKARGLDDKAKPIVEGRVECSSAYAVPNFAKSSPRSSPFFSNSSIGSLPCTASSGQVITQKFTAGF